MPQLQSSPNQWNQRGFSVSGLFATKLRNRLNDESVLWLSCVGIINIIEKTVLNLINNSLINYAGTNSSYFTMILSFYRSKSHSFQNPKKSRFSRVFFSVTRNPGFKILPRIGNTIFDQVKHPDTDVIFLLFVFCVLVIRPVIYHSIFFRNRKRWNTLLNGSLWRNSHWLFITICLSLKHWEERFAFTASRT